MKSDDQMTATNIRLPRVLLRRLKRVAVDREMSLSRLVREILVDFLARARNPLPPEAYRDDPLFEIGRKPGRSGVGDLAERHDTYLYGTKP